MVLDDSMPSTQSPLSGGIEGKGERDGDRGRGEKWHEVARKKKERHE